jgi:hypothetical protein
MFYFLLAFINIVLSSIPLYTNTARNFEYEYTILLNIIILISYVIAPISLNTKSAHSIFNKISQRPNIYLLWTLVFSPLSFFILPASAFLLEMCPCSSGGFLFWMLINTYPAIVLSQAIFLFIVKKRLQTDTKKKLSIYFFLVSICLLIYFILLFWSNPQKRGLSFIFGFIHGSIYDTWIPIDLGIILARSGHLIISAAIATYLLRKIKTSCTLLPIALIMLILSTKYPSTSHGKASLKKLLPLTVTKKNHSIHHNFTDLYKVKLINLLSKQTIFHIQEISDKLKISKPPFVEIYVYPSEYEKKIWFGSSTSDVTDIYTPSIHIELNNFFHTTLRHELVHALSSKEAYWGLGFHPNMALTEGLAMALAPDSRTINADSRAAFLIKKNLISDINSLFSPAFWKEANQRAYSLAESFLSYLLENYPQKNLMQVYQGEDFKTIYKKTLAEIILLWKSYILNLKTDGKNNLYLKKIFRDPGIFDASCPHSKVDLSPHYAKYNFAHLKYPFNWEPSRDYSDWIKQFSSNTKYNSLKKIKHKLHIKIEQKELSPKTIYQKTIVSLEKHFPKKIIHIEDAEAMLLKADLLFLTENYLLAKDTFAYLLEQMSSHYFGDLLSRHITIRRLLKKTYNREDMSVWILYLNGLINFPKDITISTWPSLYLKLKNPYPQKKKNFLLQCLETHPPESTNATLLRQWYKSLSQDLMLHNLWQQAASSWKLAASHTKGSQQKLYQQYSRLSMFLHNNKGSQMIEK